MAILAPIRDRLCYPAGYSPGFDPSHPAAAGCYPNNGFSGVPMFGSGQYRNILNGKKANTITGVPTKNIWGVLGPTIVFNSTTMGLSFTGQSTVTMTTATLAAIFYCTNVVTGNTQWVISLGGGFAGFNTFNNNIFIANGGGNVDTGLTVLVNTPYFFATSLQANLQNHVLVNLKTGQINVSVTTNASGLGAAGTVIVGNDNLTTEGATGGIATAMWSRAFLSIPQLVIWASDPWAFWYPDITAMDDFLVGGSTPIPPSATPLGASLMPMMGVG